MNLTSCDNCGVVLDKDKLQFPKDITRDDGTIDTSKAVWDGDGYVAKVSCPVCGEDITQ
jgi:RNA polymerase subunit RPABC4/transcription elongation factor Spt4